MRRIGDGVDMLGEGPVWDGQAQALYWVDIKAPCIRRWTPGTDAYARWAMPDSIGSLALASDGRVMVALRDRLALFDMASGAIADVAALRQDGEGIRANDGKCDRHGRFWLGTMDEAKRAKRGWLYRLDRGVLSAVLDGLDVPNSLCWAPDGRTMYFTDSPKRAIWAFPYDPASGALGERRVFATCEGESPDGATVDADGFLWSARYGGGRVVRHAPDGTVDRVVEVPGARQVTCCAFGGPDLGTLFVTTAAQNLNAEQLAGQPGAGGLFALEAGVRGVAETRYAV
jgi:sugar lactone lactonase YvrE